MCILRATEPNEGRKKKTKKEWKKKKEIAARRSKAWDVVERWLGAEWEDASARSTDTNSIASFLVRATKRLEESER